MVSLGHNAFMNPSVYQCYSHVEGNTSRATTACLSSWWAPAETVGYGTARSSPDCWRSRCVCPVTLVARCRPAALGCSYRRRRGDLWRTSSQCEASPPWCGLMFWGNGNKTDFVEQNVFLTLTHWSLGNLSEVFDKQFSSKFKWFMAEVSFCEFAVRWISIDLTDDKSTLVQVMA